MTQANFCATGKQTNQKKKVAIHVKQKEHIPMVAFLEHALRDNKIEYTVEIDGIAKNRRYPYITVNDKVICIKRVILQKREGKI